MQSYDLAFPLTSIGITPYDRLWLFVMKNEQIEAPQQRSNVTTAHNRQREQEQTLSSNISFRSEWS